MEKFSILELDLEEAENALYQVGRATAVLKYMPHEFLSDITEDMITKEMTKYDKEDLEQLSLAYNFDKNGNIALD